MDAELAELIGYFMGDGSLHARGLRFCVAAGDDDVVDHLVYLGKSLFGLEARTTPKQGYTEVAYHSVRLVEWWEACGFRKLKPYDEHEGKGWKPLIPDAVLHTNDRAVYAAFIRGLFEADGTVTAGVPHWSSTDQDFTADVQALLLHLGFPTTTKWDRSGWGESRLFVVRLLNTWFHTRFLYDIGFLSIRKQTAISLSENRQAARKDRIPVSRGLIDRVFPVGHPDRGAALQSFGKGGVISRRLAVRRLDEVADEELARLCRFFYDTIATSELSEEELTYDLSVPANVSYVANGFVSHNTISFMVDADTTGIEPDLGLVKLKKLVGGGTLQIVNQTVPRALRRLGYTEDQVAEIVAHVAEHHSALGAPHLESGHLAVFACAMGDNVISYGGHLRMMSAIQPFFSGAMSKTVNVPEDTTVDEIEQLLIDAWRSGIKCVALYRDNCKVTQPLSTGKQKAAAPAGAIAADAVTQVVGKVARPVRERLPRSRRSRTFEFRVADCKGFVTVGEYDDGRPGELFIRVSKQGSTLAGIMDAFAISVSHGLQYGVPLRAFVSALVGMRFEPAGITDDPEVRIANSLIDYLFRRLALEYLPYDERVELGILGTSERTQPTLPGVEEAAVETAQGVDVVADPPSPHHDDPGPAAPVVGSARPASDAPLCMTCGVAMTRAGSCFVCQECGTTSGCS
jgi:ribonucleoside-diphosphate reductase alpha chain